MISLAPVIQQLADKPPGFALPWFRKVGGAAEYASIRPEALPLPAAWIVRAADKSTASGECTELVELGFDVVIAIENRREHGAGETDDLLLQYRRAVKDRLLGYRIESDIRPLRFIGGQVLEYTAGDLYWRDRYQFQALVTNYLPDPDSTFSGINLMEAKN